MYVFFSSSHCVFHWIREIALTMPLCYYFNILLYLVGFPFLGLFYYGEMMAPYAHIITEWCAEVRLRVKFASVLQGMRWEFPGMYMVQSASLREVWLHDVTPTTYLISKRDSLQAISTMLTASARPAILTTPFIDVKQKSLIPKTRHYPHMTRIANHTFISTPWN